MARNMVTVSGMVGRDPEHRVTGTGEVTNFSVAVTERVKDASGQWSDGATTWYKVEAWKSLGQNAAASIRKGQPVVVHGELTFRDYPTRDGGLGREARIRAYTIGHDLSRGTSTFQRVVSQRPAAGSTVQPPAAAQPPAPAQPSPDRSGEWGAPGLGAAPAAASVAAPSSGGYGGAPVALLEPPVDDRYDDDEPPF